MTIKDAAKELKVEAHVLRYWEEELGLEIARNEMGHRTYSEKDIRMFQKIMELKEKGLSLKDIGDGIRLEKRRMISGNNEREVNSLHEYGRTAERAGVNGNQNRNIGMKISLQESGDEDERSDEIKVVDFKTAQLQSVMNKIIANALRENKSIITSSIRAEITEDVMKQMDVILSEKEEREEERFRKLDDVLRRLQQSNEEVAATKTRGGLFKKKRK